jgi:hypothetical protein
MEGTLISIIASKQMWNDPVYLSDPPQEDGMWNFKYLKH